jgi:sugar O-acyltransferase (sialic acid O-acetyltransferase NeuD family)
MRDIILIGAGGHALSCIDVIERNGGYRIAGLVGADDELHQRIAGYEVIGADKDLERLADEYACALITIGQIKTAEPRVRLFQKARDLGFDLPIIVSPLAHVSRSAQIGEGTIIMHMAVVNSAAVIGANCIVNTQALIEHNVEVGDHCHISTRVVLNGHVRVGSFSFIGSSSVTTQGISVGSRCVVGIGSLVQVDVPDGTTLRSGAKNG